MSSARLDGRVAVVTGGGQGIGQSIAERFSREGATVAVVDVDEARADAVAARIAAAGGRAVGIGCDVTRRDQVFAAADRVASELGTIDVLVSNAGVTRPAMLWKMTDDEWDVVMDVHLKGTFYWLQAVVGPMKEARRGSIIFTSSAAGIIGSIGQINYAAAKAGLLGMARSAARELAPYDITVNAVAPAAATPMTETVRTDERFKDKFLEQVPLARWADPEEIAGSYVYLASDDAKYMTGQVLSIDGGRVMVR